MSDPRFEKFLKDKLENYPFATKLMEFSLERTTKPTWEEFVKKSQFPIPLPDGPLKQCQIIFRAKYARCWIEKHRHASMDDALSLIYGIFGNDAEITPQEDERAIGVMIRDEDSCDNLIKWLSGTPPSKSDFLSAKDLFKLVRKENILKAIKDFEDGIEHEFGPSTQYDLIHEEKPFPPKAILGIACKYVEGGRILKPEEFSGGEESACFKTLRREGFKIVIKKATVNYWIFQCNPRIYDGVTALRDKKVYDWTVAAHKGKIKKGDRFILYITGQHSGCYALGKVTSEVLEENRTSAEVLDEYSKELDLREDWRSYVNVDITHNFYDSPVLKNEILGNNKLANFKGGVQGTNFSATEEEYNEILKLFESKLRVTSRRFWLYAPGEQGRYWRDCWERKEMFLLWDQIPDLRNFSTKDQIKEAFFKIDQDNTNPSNDTLALWEFSKVMKPGDIIIAKQGKTKYLGYGVARGDYIYSSQVDVGFHTRAVEWKKHGEWEDPVGAFALKTLTDITNLETSSPDYDTYVDRLIDLIGIELDEQPQALERTKETMINYSLIQELQSACKEAGLQYPEKLLQRFTASMLAKRFLILTGLSGSGKTKLAQAFTEWLGNSTTTTDPFYPGAGIESSQKTYRVAKSDSLSVEFWNDESEENSTKVTLGREMIKEWANCISENNFTKETSPRTIRDVINETSQFSPQLHSFETHLKAAAFAFIESQKNEFSHECTEIIPVGSDWTSNENILGYPDGLNASAYNSTPILDLVLRAELKADLPHFLILDEMNLSHVERYFADMLSAIESDEAIPLYEGNYDDPNSWRSTSTKKKIPPKVKLPKNLFVIGTVNVDETTYMFSPKVLDRANVIEFRVESEDMENFLKSGSQKPDLSKLAGTGSLYAKQFVPAQFSEISDDNQFSDEINRFFKIFSKYDAEFGFRVANEASRLINFQKLLGSDSFNENFDSVIIQKFLPKLHGSRSQLEELLQELIIATISNENQEWADELLENKSSAYPLSFNKLCRMYRKLQRDQFVSFSEA